MKTISRRLSRRKVTGAVLTGVLGLGVFAAAPAYADPTPAGAAIPSHVSAPYYYNYNDKPSSDQLKTLSTTSTANYLTLAFLQTAKQGDCQVVWNGKSSNPVGTMYKASIDAIRAAGGDVFPSFGGQAAGDAHTEIADSCTDVNAIADEYKRVITAYDFTRLDMDIETGSLQQNDDGTYPAAIDRRNKAIKIVQDWAAAEGRTLEIVFTQPTFTNGLNGGSLHLLQNAIANGVRIDGVNIMTFDYYDDVSEACGAGTGPGHDMAADTITAATALYGILHGLYPKKSSEQIWRMIGIIEMPGKSDYDLYDSPLGKNSNCETFTIQNAATVLDWATAQNIKTVSFWVLQDDKKNTGGAPAAYSFAKTFAPFSHDEPPASDPVDASSGTISATIPEGEFVWSVESDSVDLGEATLGSDFWESTGDLMPVNVTDTRTGNPAWSISAQVSDFSNGTTTLGGKYLGWEPTVVTAGAGAVAGARVDVGIYTGDGLSVSSVLASAPDGHVKGSAVLSAGLDFVVPLDTEAGTYAATLTLTAIS